FSPGVIPMPPRSSEVRSEVLAFLQAIKETPDDDGPRLIFADWLEEHDDPRGEFIRVQCALTRMSWDDPRRGDLQRRMQELLQQHEKEWLGPLGAFKGIHCWWRRGLVHMTASSTTALVKNEQLAEEETAVWLEHLTVEGRVGPRAAHRLANCPVLVH